MDPNTIQSSSSNSSHMIRKYDVFISFRGKDTRYGFTDHLFAALHRKGLPTFRDDKKIKKGEPIALELQNAIEGSQVFIIVFSRNYASSTWCLRELAKIASFINVSGKHVLPVFYDVDPSEVRKQSGNYEKAFVEHEQRFKQDLKMVQTWKAALTEVANLSGWDVRDKPQQVEIEKIVEKIITIVGGTISGVSNDLVGWQSPIQELEKLLLLGSNDNVRIIGINGMGGIGKTTLATILYKKIYHQYDACCFIDDVSKICRNSGPMGVLKELLFQTLNLEISNLFMATNLIQTRLRHMKVLIVLDNVDQVEQIEKLVVNHACLGAKSTIIMTSRDKHILNFYGVDAVYHVQLLKDNDAFKLFCKNAFKCDDILGDYRALTNEALNHAKGLPLAIKVLGSFLYGRNVCGWRSALDSLKENPTKNIMDVLRISFDGLEKMFKEIFLDIACFFHGEYQSDVETILNSRGFYPDIGIDVLIDRALITINEFGRIQMHGLLIELGRSIVKEESPKEPRKWSRIWDYEDLHNILLGNKPAENLEAIVMRRLVEEIPAMRADALSQMSCLNLLILEDVEFSGSLNDLPSKLGYLHWDKYPFTCLPSKFEPNKLVGLILLDSNIKQLWEGSKQVLHSLRYMDLSRSKNLIKMPDFSGFPNLKKLSLEGCIKLGQIDLSSGLLKELHFMNLSDCKNLIKMPDLSGFPNLVELDLEGCIKLRQIDLSSGLLENLLSMKLRDCKNLIKMLDFSKTPNLQGLDLEGCIKLMQINPSISHLKKLLSLSLKNCKNLVNLPKNIMGLCSLQFLNLSGCSKLFKNQELEKPWHVKRLKMFDTSETAIHCQSTSTICKMLMLPIHFFNSWRYEDSTRSLWPSLPCFPYLLELDLSFCNLLQIPDSIGSLPCLQSLNLGGNNFVTLPSSIKNLSTLAKLNLEHCKQLKYLPELPSITVIPRARRFFSMACGVGLNIFDRSRRLSMACWVGLNIFDCPSLCEVERSCSMVFSWMIQFIEVNVRSSFPINSIHIVIPGSQIPRWINKQNVGSSISMDPSPIMRDTEWIGVACCATFVACRVPIFDNMLEEEDRGISFRINKWFGSGTLIPINLEKDLVTVELDHLVLIFLAREQLVHHNFTTHDLDGLEITTNSCWSQGLCLEVKNCGYRWVFKEDLEQLNPTMMHSRETPALKRKFITIDDEAQP